MGISHTKKQEHLKIIQAYLVNMPSLSTTVTKVLSVCNSPATSANDLNKVVSLDPVLTGNVLKLINSAYYSVRDQVTSLTQAIIMLGLNTIRNLALSTAVLGAAGNKTTKRNDDMDKFWAHCICTGVTAKAIALEIGVPKSECEEYFVAGLLHDLGKLPLIHCFPNEYQKITAFADQKKTPLIVVEKAIFDITHEETGKLIAQKWELQGAIHQSICFHHHPQEATEDSQRIVFSIALADIFGNRVLDKQTRDEMPDNPIVINALEKLNLTWPTFLNLEEHILQEIENAKVFMQIAQKG
ncbi:MAG: HDOD domain-containing protein [Desulfobacteraceae bacterium]|nr:HDOD domain-containing protein [Desulfobacteraceae bacterium]